MAQQPPSAHRAEAASAPGGSQRIEKGWTVYDAVGRPIGNVTDTDTERGSIILDGRPTGFDTFEIPLSAVARSGDNEVHLSKAIDPVPPAAGGTPRLVDPPAGATPAGGSRSGTWAGSTAASTAAGTRAPAGSTGVAPESPQTFRELTPPYAAAESTARSGSSAPHRAEDEGSRSSVTKIATGALALGGLAATTYFLRRRMRRRSAFERFMDAAADYASYASSFADAASDFARQRHPAWWASLAAAALPIAYYAWPSKPTYRERARVQAEDAASFLDHYLGAYLGAKSGWLPANRRQRTPSRSGFEVPSDWRPAGWMPSPFWESSSSWRRPSDWSFEPKVFGPVGLLAAGAMAYYVTRRLTSRPRRGSRIADVMTRQPRAIHPDASVADAAAMMRRLNIGAIPVCDGSRLTGMLTDRDITLRSTADGRDPHLTPVRDVMSRGVAWATEDDPVEEATRIMREHRIRRLPIVDGQHSLVGVVSLGDLAVDVSDDELTGDALGEISEPSRPDR
jgi:CBS domain-containing protein